jgi:hypothetical protein
MKINMRPFRRRTRFERVVKAAGETDLTSSKGVKTGVTAVVATTAASAAISALRRRSEGARSHQ